MTKRRIATITLILLATLFSVLVGGCTNSTQTDPVSIVGTYQTQPGDETNSYFEVLVITADQEVYIYRQFEPLLKTNLTKHQDHIYSFDWNGTKFIQVYNEGLHYLTSQDNEVVFVKKTDTTASFINVKAEDFE